MALHLHLAFKRSNNIHSQGQILLMNKLKFKQLFKFTAPLAAPLIRVIHVTFSRDHPPLLLLFKLFISSGGLYGQLPASKEPTNPEGSPNPALIWQLL